MRRHPPVPAALLLALLAGCAAPPPAPPAAPPVAVPASWQSPVPWVEARPADHLAKGAWWSVFGDANLDALINEAERSSPTLAIVAARLKQAQVGTQFARAALLPRVDATLHTARQATSANRPAASYGAQPAATVQNDTVLGASVSYEPDLFGRIAFDTAAAAANERQALADLANARLLLAADLAAAYFALRQVDAEIAAVSQSIEAQSRAVALLGTRHERGAASALDVLQQQAQLDGTRTQLELLQRQRPLVEHALATLSGRPASAFRLPADAAWHLAPPAVPPALPAEALQRRPDIAAAQQAVAAANAQIGVARAAFYPSLLLRANGGYESRQWRSLFGGPSLLWSLGLDAAQALFDGGRNQARLDSARAAHEAVSAAYRLTVLRALQETEDALSSLHALRRAAQAAQAAEASSAKALDIAQARYAGGLASHLEVLTAQQSLLNSRRQAAQINGQQLAASVLLIKALGGGWQDAPL